MVKTAYKDNPGMGEDMRYLKKSLTKDRFHDIPADLWRRAKAAAVLSGVPLKVWIADAMREKLGEKVR